jgi:hypothetical protein
VRCINIHSTEMISSSTRSILWVVPMRQRIETVVNHSQGVAQVFWRFAPRAKLAKLVVMRVFSAG